MGKHGKARARDSARERRVANNRKLNQKARLRKSIRKWDDPVLYQVCEPVEQFDDGLKQLVKDMIDVLKATKDGVGLAAPQIGVTKRVLVYRTSLSSNDYTVMVNPILVDNSLDTVRSHEGCLSFPGYQAVVDRYGKVQINWKTVNGEDKTKWLEGRESVIFQHEADHLEGVCAVKLVWEAKTGRGEKIEALAELNEAAFGYDKDGNEVSDGPNDLGTDPEGEEAYAEHQSISEIQKP